MAVQSTHIDVFLLCRECRLTKTTIGEMPLSQSGSKIILYHRASLISILRDDVSDIKFAKFWDLPGGGIEGYETPFEALQREVTEELGLEIQSGSIVWRKTYTNANGLSSYFFAAPIGIDEIGKIRFGDEGQRWELMPIEQFCSRKDAVPHFRTRVAEFFDQL